MRLKYGVEDMSIMHGECWIEEGSWWWVKDFCNLRNSGGIHF